ncbi:class B sortase [Enterococcus durans]|nr:class B sortase [Enterococcus durans]QPQ26412.1 class B sortase [Enterococcus durans]QXB38199.1 class B sortase [Enterococcus durans]
MSGSIFMDYRNKKDFSDFNSIIYGHHMAESAMFGDLDKFKDQKFLRNTPLGISIFKARITELNSSHF